MTSVTAAADIWSVACLSIELLTGQAPYYDLQPMSALFRIVQDEHPPLPEDISPGMHNMLLQCFNKDPQKRPDARTLLRHPWIQHNRQTLRSSWSRTQGPMPLMLHLTMYGNIMPGCAPSLSVLEHRHQHLARSSMWLLPLVCLLDSAVLHCRPQSKGHQDRCSCQREQCGGAHAGSRGRGGCTLC